VLVLVAEEVMGSVSVLVKTVKKSVTSTVLVLVLCICSVATYEDVDGTGWRVRVLVWTIYDCAGGGVTPPSQIVVPLSTEKKYKPDAVGVDDIASVVLSGPARVSVTAIVSVISSIKVVTTVVKAGLAAAVELTMSELAP